MNHRETVNLDNIFDKGAVQERFLILLKSAIENIDDANTDPEAVRSITLEFILKPSKTRKVAVVGLKTKVKLAGMVPVIGEIFLSNAGNQVRAYPSDPRQDDLFIQEKSPSTGAN